MANLRTMIVRPDRPFADFTGGLELHRQMIDKGISGEETSPSDFPDDLSRILYELVRDQRLSGMSPFTISWLYGTLKKRAEYLPTFAQELVTSRMDVVNGKYLEWMEKSKKQRKLNDHNPAEFMSNINELLQYLSHQKKYLRLPRHPKVPHLPVFVATFGVGYN